jgi:hypothetical protein
MQKNRPQLIWTTVVILLGLLLMLIDRGVLSDPSVTISWEVGSQLDIQGFNVYRGSTNDTNLVRVNNNLITGSEDFLAPQEFSYVDHPTDDQAEFRYLVEIVSTDGNTNRLEAKTYRISRNPGWFFWIGFIMLWIGLGLVLVEIKSMRRVVNN